MWRYAVLFGLLAAVLSSAPASAVGSKEKLKTCNFGATAQKLTGAARKAFIKKCMADEDEPAQPGDAPPK